jgi:hypothetical protein
VRCVTAESGVPRTCGMLEWWLGDAGTSHQQAHARRVVCVVEHKQNAISAGASIVLYTLCVRLPGHAEALHAEAGHREDCVTLATMLQQARACRCDLFGHRWGEASRWWPQWQPGGHLHGTQAVLFGCCKATSRSWCCRAIRMIILCCTAHVLVLQLVQHRW